MRKLMFIPLVITISVLCSNSLSAKVIIMPKPVTVSDTAKIVYESPEKIVITTIEFGLYVITNEKLIADICAFKLENPNCGFIINSFYDEKSDKVIREIKLLSRT